MFLQKPEHTQQETIYGKHNKLKKLKPPIMGQVKFGSKQLRNPTPHKIGILMDFLSGVLSVVSAFFTTASFIDHDVSDIVTGIVSGLLIPILLLAKRFFGVPQTEDEVPVEDVTEVETKSKEDN